MSEDLLNEQDKLRLEKTQSVRERFIDMLVKEGVPEDKEDKIFLAKLLDGSDKAILNKSKIISEDNTNKSGQESAILIAEILSKHIVEAPAARTDVPEMSSDIQVDDLVTGELDQGVSDLNYDKFMSSEKD